MFRRRLRSIGVSLKTFPDARGWRNALILFAVFAVAAGAVGFGSGFLTLRPVSWGTGAAITLPILFFVKPSFLEELVFRAALVPHPAEGLAPAKQWTLAALSLGLFVGVHPLSGFLFHPGADHAVFFDHTFLSLALLLGIVSTAAYTMTGSLWPSVLMHWITVTTWIELLGGASRLALDLGPRR